MSIKKLNLPRANLAIFSNAPGLSSLLFLKKSLRSIRLSFGNNKFNKSIISAGLLFRGVADMVTQRSDSTRSNAAWSAMPQLFFSALLYTLCISSHINNEFFNSFNNCSFNVMLFSASAVMICSSVMLLISNPGFATNSLLTNARYPKNLKNPLFLRFVKRFLMRVFNSLYFSKSWILPVLAERRNLSNLTRSSLDIKPNSGNRKRSILKARSAGPIIYTVPISTLPKSRSMLYFLIKFIAIDIPPIVLPAPVFHLRCSLLYSVLGLK